MEEWKECRLGDILNFRRGYDLPKTKMVSGKIPVAGSNGIIGYHNEATPITPCITIGRSGNVGTPYIYKQCWAHNTVLYVDDFKGNDPYYLYYLLKTLPLASFGGGSAVPTLNRNHIHPIEVKYTPNLNIQKRIVSVLSSLDGKIQNNKQINSNLEEQAKALFKSWFIDFEPFKGGKFVDSELGKIPEGWEVSYLEHLGKFKRGKTIIAKNAKEGLIPVVAGGMEPAYYHNEANTKGPVITVSASGANAGYMRLYYQDVWASDCSFLDSSNENLLWIYSFLNNNRRVLRHAQTGAVQPHVKPADINSITVCIPPHDLISKFQNTVSPLFKSIGLHQQETEILQKTRDTLLPKLMSGEIDVEHSKLLFI
ncbi:MAG: restriction endonuclease subunit S [Prevotella sp.]|jgi:type I restriction enzyme S subunit|nr:restriction endonuclease subunit S [Prevotella sp.]